MLTFEEKLDQYRYSGKPGRPRNAFIADHGTVARYQHPQYKCRCTKCREAWRHYKLLYRRRRKIDLVEKAIALEKVGRFAEAQLIRTTIRTKS